MMTFTPLFEPMVDKYGITTAAIYGSIWRYCQQNGTCFAAVETIGARVGIKQRAAYDKIKTLVSEGIILDLTPDNKNRPHLYKLNAMHEMHSGMHEMHSGYARNAYKDTNKKEYNNGSSPLIDVKDVIAR